MVVVGNIELCTAFNGSVAGVVVDLNRVAGERVSLNIYDDLQFVVYDNALVDVLRDEPIVISQTAALQLSNAKSSTLRPLTRA